MARRGPCVPSPDGSPVRDGRFDIPMEDCLIQAPEPGVAVETRGLKRWFRTRAETIVALGGVDLSVRAGELFGVLGPNGAGKTTLIKILVTLLLPSEGEAYVDGLDVQRDAARLRHRIAMVSGGENSGYGLLRVREQLWMFSQLYGMPSALARRRIDDLLDRLGLSEAADRKVHALSSGMRQKMNLIRGLITDPRVLFLDEPTVALDVGAARDLRREVRRWMDEDPSRTVILTTHYMQEADEMCDRLVIVNQGRVIAHGTPGEIKHSVRPAFLASLDGGPEREPTLEDAFVQLVGASMSEIEEGVAGER
jgi:ABC-2 type transport system ATP-binding protein